MRFISGHNAVPPPVLRGSDSPHWLGDDVSYAGIHVWLAKHHAKTGVCAECGAVAGDTCQRTEWAFLRHPKPHTRNIADYRELCTTCHHAFDYEFRHASSRQV